MLMSLRRDSREKERLTFATFFPQCENIHLAKDIGMIPYILARDYGYDSLLISYKNGEYPYLRSEVPGLRHIIMKKGALHGLDGFRECVRKRAPLLARLLDGLVIAWDALPVLIRHGRKIDVLQLYHFDDESIIVGWMYKLFNGRGMTYLKLDISPDTIEEYRERPGKLSEKASIFYRKAPFDILSIETQELYDFLRKDHPLLKTFGDRLYYLPNGIDYGKLSHYMRSFGEKENMVLHLGRLGMPQKATEVVLEAFTRAAGGFPGWKLVMIGHMEDGFYRAYEGYFSRPGIEYKGFLDSREEVYKYFGRAKVLAAPSRFESFGLVIAEGGALGDLILGSDIPSIREMTNGGEYGYLCKVDDVDCFTRTLRSIMAGGDGQETKSAQISGFIREKFNWTTVCGELDGIVRAHLRGEAR